MKKDINTLKEEGGIDFVSFLQEISKDTYIDDFIQESNFTLSHLQITKKTHNLS